MSQKIRRSSSPLSHPHSDRAGYDLARGGHDLVRSSHIATMTRAALAAALLLGATCTARAAERKPVAATANDAANATVPADTVLLDAMQAELVRAMKDLGTVPVQGAHGAAAATPKPYFLSYSVSDADRCRLRRSSARL